ncbi:MAG: hypothetical protein J6K73_08410 [Clostridia bacterium]|nr:hypothetical protein [Clostridia bacterium]MBP3649789.1 hypothetical protein [Clostridia bacterium]
MIYVLFYRFATQEDRRKAGGSCYLEIQYCRLPNATPIEELVSVQRVSHWQDDSLYIQDASGFLEAYGRIFDGGTYANLKSGEVDLWGINYYTPAMQENIIQRIQQEKPADCQILLAWLQQASSCNGFYLLGF